MGQPHLPKRFLTTTALFVVLVVASLGCKKPVDRTAPPGTIGYTISDNGSLAIALYPEKVVFLKDGKAEESVNITEVNGANFTPGGMVLFHENGKRVIAYRDYGGEPAKQIMQRVLDRMQGNEMDVEVDDDNADAEEEDGEDDTGEEEEELIDEAEAPAPPEV